MPDDLSGRYIVLEGIEGVGKTTQMQMLQKHLKSLGIPHILVREPGGTPLGEAIRKILKDSKIPRTPKRNVELFSYQRKILMEDVVSPALSEGLVVLSDRCWVTTYAYHGFAEGEDTEEILKITKEVAGPIAMQAQVVLLDADPQAIFDRRSLDEKKKDYFDSKDVDYFMRAREGYLDAASRINHKIVDALRPKEMVHADIVAALGLANLKL